MKKILFIIISFSLSNAVFENLLSYSKNPNADVELQEVKGAQYLMLNYKTLHGRSHPYEYFDNKYQLSYKLANTNRTVREVDNLIANCMRDYKAELERLDGYPLRIEISKRTIIGWEYTMLQGFFEDYPDALKEIEKLHPDGQRLR